MTNSVVSHTSSTATATTHVLWDDAGSGGSCGGSSIADAM